MENMKIVTHGKLHLRELNLGQGGNNVRWLNDREDRILEKSLNSLERARQKTLSRLQHEVKGLHHTLREQVTIRSPQLLKKSHFPDNDNNETKRPAATIHSVTFNLPDQILGRKPEDGTRGLVEDLEESTLEHIALEDSSSENKSERHLGKTSNQQADSAWTRKISPGNKTPLKRILTKQLSNVSEQSASSTTTVSVPRRKISVTDPPLMKELSPRLRKTYSHSSLQVGPANSTLNRTKARSSETILNVASTHSSGSGLNEPFTPSLRKTSVESINRVASPLFLRRTSRLSAHHPPSLSTPPRPRRKISAPSKMQLYRVQQEEVIPLQLSRDNNGSTSRPATTMVTDLPKLGVSHGIEHAQGLHFDGNVSPLGLHVDSTDCTLQEKVNNFLRSLERSEDSHESEETLPNRADNL